MSESSFSRAIGVIGKPHGIRGYVYVRMFTDYPDSIKKDSLLYLDEKCLVKTRVEDVRSIISGGKNKTIFKLDKANGRKEAELLRNEILYREKQNEPELEKDTFWIDDLNGCEIFLKDDSLVGTVMDVEKYAYNDNLLVSTGTKNILIIPMLDEYIDKIDIEKKKIILKKLPEFI